MDVRQGLVGLLLVACGGGTVAPKPDAAQPVDATVCAPEGSPCSTFDLCCGGFTCVADGGIDDGDGGSSAIITGVCTLAP